MYPGFFGWWGKAHHGHGHHGRGCGPRAERGCGPGEGSHCGPGGFGRGHHGHGPPFGHGGPPGGGPGGEWDGDGGGFGVRRPLRFLAWKLELEEEQVAKLAIILDELKTERAQAAVDQRRSVAAFADAVSGDTFDEAKAKEAGDSRVKTAEQLRDAVVRALSQIHGLLDAEQKKKLSYLLRTGTLVI